MTEHDNLLVSYRSYDIPSQHLIERMHMTAITSASGNGSVEKLHFLTHHFGLVSLFMRK